ncbi:hypothetical protein M758_10G051100 [Ceratodon purpureus]|nr:hypothetical protein M758_10G051100 [Ceratodon purpureus]
MDTCKWKITYNNPNHCSMMELAHTPTRPPWRPAASSITANLDLDVPPPQWSSRKSQKSVELTIPPQYMSATDLIAAMPKRHRMPKPQSLSNALAVEEPRVYPKTPWAPSLTSQLEAAEFGKPSRRSSEHTPKSVLDHAKSTSSDARSRSNTGKHGSQLASPPSAARSLLNSAAQSERDFGGSERSFPIASPRHKRSHQSSPGMSQQGSPPRKNASSNDRASPASPAGSARSPERSPGHSPPYSESGHNSRHRTTATNSGLASVNDTSVSQSTNPRSSRYDTRGSSSRMTTTDTHNNNLPSRGTTGGSVRSMSACSSVTHRSMEGSPASGRCSPPTPASPSSPTYSPY